MLLLNGPCSERMVRLLRVPGKCWDRKDAYNRVVCVRDARIGKNVIQCATYGSAKPCDCSWLRLKKVLVEAPNDGALGAAAHQAIQDYLEKPPGKPRTLP